LAESGIRGLAVAAGLLVVLVVASLLVPRIAPRAAANVHVQTLAWASVWLVGALGLNGLAVFCAGRDLFALAWVCYGLAAACAAGFLVTALWRTVAAERRRDRGR